MLACATHSLSTSALFTTPFVILVLEDPALAPASSHFGLCFPVMERVQDGCGLQKERRKRAEADRKRIGRASERMGSRRTWLQLMRCTLMHTGVLFRKADQTEKETGEPKSIFRLEIQEETSEYIYQLCVSSGTSPER